MQGNEAWNNVPNTESIIACLKVPSIKTSTAADKFIMQQIM